MHKKLFKNHCFVWYYLANQIEKEMQNGNHEPGCTSGSEPDPARGSDRGADGDSVGGESDRDLVSEFEHGFESHWGYIFPFSLDTAILQCNHFLSAVPKLESCCLKAPVQFEKQQWPLRMTAPVDKLP